MTWEIAESIASLFLNIALGAALVAIAFKFKFKFDINEYQKHQYRKQVDKLQSLCTHTTISPQGGRYAQVESLFTNPTDKNLRVCRQCGQRSDIRSPKADSQYWVRHFQEYKEKKEKTNKLLKKMGRA